MECICQTAICVCNTAIMRPRIIASNNVVVYDVFERSVRSRCGYRTAGAVIKAEAMGPIPLFDRLALEIARCGRAPPRTCADGLTP